MVLASIEVDFAESHCLRVQCKLGDEFLLKLNTHWRPIANKYCEGKLQRTLERELEDPETANGEGFGNAILLSYSGVGGMTMGECLRGIFSPALPVTISLALCLLAQGYIDVRETSSGLLWR